MKLFRLTSSIYLHCYKSIDADILANNFWPNNFAFLLYVTWRCLFCGSFLLFLFRVCHVLLSVHCSLVVICWVRAGLLLLLRVMFSSVFVTFPFGVLGQVWYLILTVPDICLLSYLVSITVFFLCNVKIITFYVRNGFQSNINVI